jgi:hypothetical protein
MSSLAELLNPVDSTGYDRWLSHRMTASETVSLNRVEGAGEDLRLLTLIGYMAGATTPAEPHAAENLVLPALGHFVLDADEVRTPAALEWRATGGNVRVLTEMIPLAVDELGDGADADAQHAAATRNIARLARQMAATSPAVDVDLPPVPELGDDPAENVRHLFGLTVAQLADLLGVTERQMYRYREGPVPEDRRELLDALVAVGLLLIGGLGADGARQWLYSGRPSAAQLLHEGRSGEVRDRAEALRDSIAS